MRLHVFIFFVILFSVSGNSQNVTLAIHLRGVYSSKISLLSLTGTNALKPIIIIDSVKNGGTAKLEVPGERLPGEFVLRFDYRDKASSTPYPSEKRIIIGSQDLELWVHPIFCNYADSTWFRKEEKENTAYLEFFRENARQKEILGLLQNFLLNYDDPGSEFYKEGVAEYEKRREAFNAWIKEQIKKNKSLFASNLFGFQLVPTINWTGTEADRKQSLRDNYFEGMDFSDPLLVKTSTMKEWMDGYVNLYGEFATTVTLRDSLFTLAGKNAIEKSRKGNPLVYGWMVDYFFNGYESFNIEKGIKMLQPFLDDPDCLTSKRQEINKRLKGIETLVPGTIVPNITMTDAEGKPFDLNNWKTEKKQILLLFWSADCSHCEETVGKLNSSYQDMEVKQALDIVAISVDETSDEIQKWENKITELKGWTHLRAEEGLRSKVANDYYILGVPVMILLDAKTKEITALPDTIEQLNKLLITK
ncbi:MAG: alkyl hydroperoxide reductase [Bacteroidetes bacterium RBG_13_43_22]|nr:MAG: alkyl hydroperoxide reductase [Bacteroidetes bacterium RBG_13_43_22]